MDKYEKCAASLMELGDQILEKKKHRNMLIRRVSFSCASTFAAVIVIFFAWKSTPPKIEQPSDILISETTTLSESIYTDNISPTTTINSGYTSNININKTITTTVTTVGNEKLSSSKTEQPTVSTIINSEQKPISQVITTVDTKITSKQTESQAPATTVTVTETKPIVNTQPNTTVTQSTTEAQITEPPTTTKVIPIQEIQIGYYDANYSKPLPSARIALKCNEFCYHGEKITIDVAKGDGSFRPQDYDSNRVYEYSVSPTENNSTITDENLIVNGEIGGYKKEYAGEDMQIFDINGKYDDYDAYQHEITEIDFNNYPIGSSGCITFSFKAVFTDDPTNTSTSGMMQNMYFYVGEIGVVVSPFGIEEAMEEYRNISSLF